MFRRALPSLLAAASLLMLFACQKAGDECTESPGSCADKTSHLVCVKSPTGGAGKLALQTCKGAGGCNDEGKTLVCDNTKAAVGDGCGPDGARACSTDGAKELRCHEGKFAVEWSCRGGCTLDASNNPKCTPVGEVGDACRPDSIVCDGAQKTQLGCVDSKLAATRTCHGPLGCVTEPGGGVRCDRSIALEGEPCTERDSGACDTTKRNVLVCEGGHFKTEMHCLGPLGCELPGNYSARCDMDIVSMDAPCTFEGDEGALSCNTDGQQVKCTNGKWAVDKTWKPKKDETCKNRHRVSKQLEKFEAR